MPALPRCPSVVGPSDQFQRALLPRGDLGGVAVLQDACELCRHTGRIVECRWNPVRCCVPSSSRPRLASSTLPSQACIKICPIRCHNSAPCVVSEQPSRWPLGFFRLTQLRPAQGTVQQRLCVRRRLSHQEIQIAEGILRLVQVVVSLRRDRRTSGVSCCCRRQLS